jgi:serine/threonine protein phosphatase PrpC
MSGKPAHNEIAELRQDIDFAGRGFIGVRESQEDYALFHTTHAGAELLAVLADGMGGPAFGEVASQKAVDTFITTFDSYPAGSVLAAMGAALQQANNELARSINETPALASMGCTLVGMHVGADGLQWISVGDSPLFLYRDGKIIRLNADHSMAPLIAESLQKGEITQDEASKHPHRNSLRSAVMGGELSMVDTSSAPVPLYQGDVIVLASDGILTLSDNEIAAQLEVRPTVTAEKLASNLIAAVEVKKRPRQDNTTVQVIIVPSSFQAADTISNNLLFLSVLLLGVVLGGAYYIKSGTMQLPNWPEWMSTAQLPSLSIKPAEIVVPKPVAAPSDDPVPLVHEVKPLPQKPQDSATKPKLPATKDAKLPTKSMVEQPSKKVTTPDAKPPAHETQSKKIQDPVAKDVKPSNVPKVEQPSKKVVTTDAKLPAAEVKALGSPGELSIASAPTTSKK